MMDDGVGGEGEGERKGDGLSRHLSRDAPSFVALRKGERFFKFSSSTRISILPFFLNL